MDSLASTSQWEPGRPGTTKKEELLEHEKKDCRLLEIDTSLLRPLIIVKLYSSLTQNAH